MRQRFDSAAHLKRRFSSRVIALLAVLSLSSALGCQGVMLGSLASSREDKRILKQAEQDPFPSPSDVGIETPKAAKP